MKTIKVNLYYFNELSEDAKIKAIEQERNKYRDNWFVQEANESFKKFADIFSVNWNIIDHEEPHRSDYKINLDDDVLELSGIRLLRYIWNNYKNDLFKGKYYPVNLNKKVNHKRVESRIYKNGNVFNGYYSAIQIKHSCVLTGVCYDDDLLQPIYDFLDKPSDIDFETLINDCIYNFCHSVSSEIEYRNSDEGINEELSYTDYEYYEDGTRY